jgi:putative membrane protein
LKIATYIGGLLGLALLAVLLIRADFPVMVQTLASAGWDLLWLIPYRVPFFLLYAIGWLVLLQPNDPYRRAGIGYLFWVTAVREAIDRLLPVASVGGSVVGIRLVRWRGLDAAAIGASVIIEIILTLIVSYLFTAAGLYLLVDISTGQEYRRVLAVFLLTLPVPIVSVLLLRYGSVFGRLQKLVHPVLGRIVSPSEAATLDHEVRMSLHRGWRLLIAGALQFTALLSGAFEIWFVMRLFGHPVGIATSVILESMTLAVRHVAFIVPAGLGVQEAGIILFGHALGIDSELALAVSMAKRMREVLWGLPSLMSWQWAEGQRVCLI